MLADTLTAEALTDTTRHLLALARGEAGARPTTSVSAARALVQLLRLGLAIPAGEDEVDPDDELAALPPAKRAAIKAELIRQAERAAADAEAAASEWGDEA